jgi:hypothetical protein
MKAKRKDILPKRDQVVVVSCMSMKLIAQNIEKNEKKENHNL